MNEISPHASTQAATSYLASRQLPFIDGAYRDVPAAGDVPVEDPATGAVVATVPDCGADAVDLAVRAAHAALSGPWSRMRPVERERLMLDLAAAVERDGDLLAEIETIENGKSLGMAKALAVGGSADWLRYYAGWATKIEGSTLDASIPVPPGARHLAMTLKEPVGVVGAIVPWNFPLLMAVWKLAPALACGCTVVLKPAEETPLATLRLGTLAAEVGFPPGVVNIVTGRGHSAGAALTAHPGIDKLTFTGSTEVGRLVGHAAVDRLARFTLELGGKSPMIMLADMPEDDAGLAAGLGMFFNQGQVCTSASRLLVQRSIWDRTLERLGAIADGMSVGSGRDPQAQINPVISSKHRDRIQGFIDRAVEGGARRASGSRAVPEQGYYVAPTILHQVKPDAEVVQDEVFGPVVAAMPFDDLDEALRLANDSRYGLSASIWTRDLSKALSAAKALKAGTVWINSHNTVDANLPFGGYKESGIGREHGRAVLDSYLETKTVVVRYA